MQNIKKSGLLKQLWWRNPFLRIAPTLSSDLNHGKIKRLLEADQLLGLRPIPPLLEGGSIEHYYHFLFDLVFPVLEIIGQAPSQRVVRIVAQTPFAAIANELFGNQIEFLDPSSISNGRITELRGMNPRVYRIRKCQMAGFQEFIRGWMAGRVLGPTVDLLLIERSLPPDYYLSSQCSVKGGGSLRRSIRNHSDINDDLRNSVDSGMLDGIKTMKNVRLEEIPLHEQINLFSNARVIIGQHGAGLSNLVFCKPGTRVLEINDRRECQHFKLLSKVAGIRHAFLWVDSPHPELSIKKLGNSVRNLITP